MGQSGSTNSTGGNCGMKTGGAKKKRKVVRKRKNTGGNCGMQSGGAKKRKVVRKRKTTRKVKRKTTKKRSTKKKVYKYPHGRHSHKTLKALNTCRR
jgi:hypothetical protein